MQSDYFGLYPITAPFARPNGLRERLTLGASGTPLGSFALMGNHEMYSGGWGYYHTFLKTLGLLNPDKSVKDPQSASYFCLDTGHWLVLGLDTGYHSGGMPALAVVPVVNSISFFNVDARFDDKMMAWLTQTMKTPQASGTKKPIRIISRSVLSSMRSSNRPSSWRRQDCSRALKSPR